MTTLPPSEAQAALRGFQLAAEIEREAYRVLIRQLIAMIRAEVRPMTTSLEKTLRSIEENLRT